MSANQRLYRLARERVNWGIRNRARPGLTILEFDFENPGFFFIGKGLDFRVKHLDGRDVQRGYKVLAILDLGIALPAEDHGATPAASLLY
jgi:hypothetical protein